MSQDVHGAYRQSLRLILNFSVVQVQKLKCKPNTCNRCCSIMGKKIKKQKQNQNQKLQAVHPVNYFPYFLGKNIKNCPPSKLFLFTSLNAKMTQYCAILVYQYLGLEVQFFRYFHSS